MSRQCGFEISCSRFEVVSRDMVDSGFRSDCLLFFWFKRSFEILVGRLQS